MVVVGVVVWLLEVEGMAKVEVLMVVEGEGGATLEEEDIVEEDEDRFRVMVDVEVVSLFARALSFCLLCDC